MNKLFVAYGSNLNLDQMSYRCPGSFVEDRGVLQNFRLTFRASGQAGVANIEPAAGSTVPVLVWSVPAIDELALDRYEGFPYFYTKKRVHVQTPRGGIMAWVYVMAPGHHVTPPGRGYLRTILDGYTRAGFPIDPLWSAVEAAGPLSRELVELKTGIESEFCG